MNELWLSSISRYGSSELITSVIWFYYEKHEMKNLIWPVQWWSSVLEIEAKYTAFQIVFNAFQLYFLFDF